MTKKLSKDSKYLKHDLDGDGIVTDEEIVLIVLAMSPIIPDTRVVMVTALLSTYIVANLGIVSVFMGTTAFTRAKENGK